MKKIFKGFICCFLLVFVALSFTACGGQKNESAVNLVAIEANSVGLMRDIDYYVVPEPAASAKVKAISELNFAGDLQELYGGEKGYPQAVVVAKNDLLGTEVLNTFITQLSSTYEWLLDDGSSIETIVGAVEAHLTDGLQPSITVQNLTKSVIENCGINFVSASENKAEIVSFMEQFNSVSEASFGTPSDEFFWTGNGSSEYSGNVSVYAPDGAPALGLAKLMSENVIENTEYNIVDATLIQTYVSGASPKADICVLPVNVAVKLLGNGNTYKLIGTLTHGNLYIVSKNGEQLNKDNLDKLKGKTVGVVNLAAVPGLTFKLILKNYGIEYVEPNNV